MLFIGELRIEEPVVETEVAAIASLVVVFKSVLDRAGLWLVLVLLRYMGAGPGFRKVYVAA